MLTYGQPAVVGFARQAATPTVARAQTLDLVAPTDDRSVPGTVLESPALLKSSAETHGRQGAQKVGHLWLQSGAGSARTVARGRFVGDNPARVKTVLFLLASSQQTAGPSGRGGRRTHPHHTKPMPARAVAQKHFTVSSGAAVRRKKRRAGGAVGTALRVRRPSETRSSRMSSTSRGSSDWNRPTCACNSSRSAADQKQRSGSCNCNLKRQRKRGGCELTSAASSTAGRFITKAVIDRRRSRKSPVFSPSSRSQE